MARGWHGCPACRKPGDLGVVFSQDAANSAAEFTDAMNELKQAFRGVQFEIGKQLAPILTDLAQWFVTNKATISTFFSILKDVALAAFKSHSLWPSSWPLARSGFLVRFFTLTTETQSRRGSITIGAVAQSILGPGGLLKTAIQCGHWIIVKSLSAIDWGDASGTASCATPSTPSTA